MIINTIEELKVIYPKKFIEKILSAPSHYDYEVNKIVYETKDYEDSSSVEYTVIIKYDFHVQLYFYREYINLDISPTYETRTIPLNLIKAIL